ncbi:MAG: hypothetical protein K9M02_11720 [Thiohalocapsa sp.]|jgi:hypothetical protein|nr:hypothetical protein [Thiohalocapsa sp.]
MCRCIEQANIQLAEQDLRLVTFTPVSAELSLLPQRAALQTERISRSRKVRPTLSATHCPFCGAKYEEA